MYMVRIEHPVPNFDDWKNAFAICSQSTNSLFTSYVGDVTVFVNLALLSSGVRALSGAEQANIVLNRCDLFLHSGVLTCHLG
jgi:hypothetical protein